MKNSINVFILLGLIAVLMLAGCQKEPYGIKFEAETVDFGTVNEGAKVDIVFEFKNTGREALEIDQVRPSCGCTTPEEWDKVVASGKKGKIPVVFDTSHYEGEVSKTITVHTNIPDQPEIVVTLAGNVYNPISADLRSIWLGEILEPTKPISRSYKLTNHKDSPIEPGDIILPEGADITFQLVTLVPEQEYRLDFTVHPPFELYEVIRKPIKIKTRQAPDSVLELSYSYMVPPPVKISPLKVVIHMGRVKEEVVEQRINIRSYVDEPIAVEDLRLEGIGTEYTVDPLAEEPVTVEDLLQEGTGIVYWVDPLNEGNFYQIALKFPMGFSFPADKPTFALSFRVKNDPRALVYTIPIEGYTPPN